MTAPEMIISTGNATDAQAELARDALQSQRRRLLDVFTSFDETWRAPTRCAEWNVHQVVRHLCDATVRWHALLRGESPELVGIEGMDPRTTPMEWLEGSANERPVDTVGVFEQSSAELLDTVDELIERGATHSCPMPYGVVPWSVIALHLFWDAWVHERDILVPQGRSPESPGVESRAAATFGLVMSSFPFKIFGASLEETVVLDGVGGGRFDLDVRDDTVIVSVRTHTDDAAEDALRGALPEVIDSLIGRDPDLTDVLKGPQDRIHALGKMRRFMLAPAG